MRNHSFSVAKLAGIDSGVGRSLLDGIHLDAAAAVSPKSSADVGRPEVRDALSGFSCVCHDVLRS